MVRRTHGQSTNKSSAYKAWAAMRKRCNNTTHKQAHRYSLRGIKICERWDDFSNFLEDMGQRPDGKTLDRIDNDKGYSKDNCRWASYKEQMRNYSRNVYHTAWGITMLQDDWCKIMKVHQSRLRRRIKELGWSIEDALSTPIRQGRYRQKADIAAPLSCK
jgi:hypothetical protein